MVREVVQEPCMVPLDSLKAYDNNAKRHTREQLDAIQASIREFGFRGFVIAWHNEDGEAEIVAGHARCKAAQQLGMDEVPVVFCDDLSDAQRRALTLADNQTTMMTGWDEDMLAYELQSLSDEYDMESFGFDMDAVSGLSEDYSQNVGTVDYEPSGNEWEPGQLFEMPDKFDAAIEALDCPEELKRMMRIRACWFCEFDYEKIADYYCSEASQEVQRVFEVLGLVLLYRDGMIENGFADLIGFATSGGFE